MTRRFFAIFIITLLLIAGQSRALPPLLARSPLPTPKPEPANRQPLQLVDLPTIAPNIRLDLRYATTNNFLKRAVYSQARCLLRQPIAEKLAKVQADLATQGFGLKVFDCYRPLSVQKQMWAILPDDRYVANPANGSRHNRGAAVDVALVDRAGKDLEMPSAFDDFSDRANSDYPKVTAAARKHRYLLAQAMQRQGFTPLITEWWHFDGPGWQNFGLLDVPFGAVKAKN
jgi:zinc D-Ala-D-Ala dipeptidase